MIKLWINYNWNLIPQIVKNALPAAGVARLRDVTKKDFGKFVDDDNRFNVVTVTDMWFVLKKYNQEQRSQYDWRLEAWGGNDDWDFEFEPEILKQQPVKVTES